MIDLHTHSNCSDGSDSPNRMVELAYEAGLTAYSLSDHDTVAGLNEASIRATELGIIFIPGIELSCHTPTRNIHLLGYMFNPLDEELGVVLQEQQELRRERNEHLIEVLQGLNFEITMDEVLAVAGNATVGRPHFAKVLMHKGYFESIDQAFVDLLGDGQRGYVTRQEFFAEDAIALIHRAGGLAVWAHPMRGRDDTADLKPQLEYLTGVGLDGIEAYYSRFEPKQRQMVKNLADHFGIVATGGSDYHGSYKPDLSIGSGTGNLAIPDEVIQQLIARQAALFGH